MNFEILRKQPLVFREKNGFKYFEPFHAIDKNKKNLNILWDTKHKDPTIIARSTYKDEISLYDMEIDPHKKEITGLSIVANPKNKGIGEVLNLASLISFNENYFNKFKVFSLKDSIQFYTKYGFNIVSDNIQEVLHNLKFISDTKNEYFKDVKNSAKYFKKQIEKDNKNKDLIILSNNLISDFIRDLARQGKKLNKYDLYNHTHLEFKPLDSLRNKDYLNELLDKHEIDYKF